MLSTGSPCCLSVPGTPFKVTCLPHLFIPLRRLEAVSEEVLAEAPGPEDKGAWLFPSPFLFFCS